MEPHARSRFFGSQLLMVLFPLGADSRLGDAG
jgi:hypothetical protein